MRHSHLKTPHTIAEFSLNWFENGCSLFIQFNNAGDMSMKSNKKNEMPEMRRVPYEEASERHGESRTMTKWFLLLFRVTCPDY
jgi:hypothetical protein